MEKSLVFGIKNYEQDDIKNILEKVLSIKFNEHSSEEQDYLFAGDDNAENFVIHHNYNDEYWDYPNHKECKIILIINVTSRYEYLQKLLTEKIPELVLLEVFEE
ncbi:MAG: hypothetical protein HQM15_08940 [Deltaproteobacteria bacterium]|nr:hypothetical protein [Deltaproteobacteria bacterium]